ncbi:hypothetical protein ACE10X_22360 [Bradyrhizobium sp. Pha-3]|uniref:hypothetical protein n=1 Tax=Bradyrhizobium sp. Pha-3 TaxID=208375 RepID=UPI0035D4C44E
MTPQRTADHSALPNRGVLTEGVHIENSAVCAVSAVGPGEPSGSYGERTRPPANRGPEKGEFYRLGKIAEALAAGIDLTAEERAAAAQALRTASLVLMPTKPGQRSVSTRMAQAEHQRLLRTMAATFYSEQSASGAADGIAKRLARYRSGPDWKRDRTAASISYRETLRGHCWAVLKAIDRPLSARRIRALLAAS